MQETVAFPAEFAARYRREGYWTGCRLGDIGRDPARSHGTWTAVATRHGRMTYQEFDERCDRLAAGLHQLGVRKGDRVVVQLPNTAEFPVTCVALFRLGALPVLALPAHRRNEVEYLCRHVDASALVIPDILQRFDYRKMAGQIRQAVPGLRHVIVAGDPQGFLSLSEVDAAPTDLESPHPEQPALLLLSGGTSGYPKLIPRTHDDYAYQMRATARAMGLDQGGTYLAVLSAAHNAALGCPGVLGALQCGAKTVLSDNPSPDAVFPLIEREGASVTTLMPTILPLWTQEARSYPVDMSGLIIELGGSAIDREQVGRAQQALGCRVTRWFGISEGVLLFTRPDDPDEVRLGTDGRPLCDADEVRIVDEDGSDVEPGQSGELLLRGPYTLRGYYRAPEHNAKSFTPNGFFRTGDLVRQTSEGNLVVTGRIKEVINRSGEKIAAEEVENLVRGHPDIRDAAAVAVPDDLLGERTYVFMVTQRAGGPTLDGLREFLVEGGAAEYKLPDGLEVVDEMPTTAVGKVDKRGLVQGLLERVEGEPA